MNEPGRRVAREVLSDRTDDERIVNREKYAFLEFVLL